VLASKLQLIQCIWGFKDAALIALWMGYETFIINIGMYGNLFSLNFELYSILVTNGTWFKNMWELLHKFKTIATFSADNHIHPVQVGDRSLMQGFSCFYGRCNLQTLNIYQQYKKSIHLSCLVLCDDHTIDKECLTPREGFLVTYHKFPLQRPSQSDHDLWIMAIKRISSDYFTLPTTLGEYVRHPQKPFKWTTTEVGSIVHLEVILDDVECYLVYMLTSDTSTWSGRKFVRSDRIDHVPLPFYASVTRISDNYIHLHSWTRQYNTPRTVQVCFGIRFSTTTILVYRTESAMQWRWNLDMGRTMQWIHSNHPRWLIHASSIT
jgi:hypothetical protein